MYESYNLPDDYQDALLACIVAHPAKFMPKAGIFNAAYFTGVQRIATARALFNYWRKNSRFPGWDTLSQVVYDAIARTSEEKDKDTINDYVKKLREQDTGDVDEIADHVVGWAKRRALYIAIDTAATKFQAGDIPPDGFVPMFEEALKVGFDGTEAHSLCDLAKATIDPADTLLGDRFLCKEGSLLFAASTGSGKSVASNQMVCAWACGKEALGIKPARPLKILVVQAEDDPGDLQEMSMSVIAALELTQEEMQTVHSNTTYLRECSLSGDEFIAWLNVQVYHTRPDLIVINPLLSYIGGKGVLDAATVTKFLRNGLNSILLRYRCACLVVHHTPKQNSSDRNTSKWRATDWIYAAAGVAEIANWCRAGIIIEATFDPYVFRFIAAKRGRRIGWTNDFEDSVQTRFFRQSKDELVIGERSIKRLFWEDATDDDIERAQTADEDAKKSGRPQSVPDTALLKALKEATVRGEGLTQDQWVDVLADAGIAITQSGLSKRCKKLRAAGKVRPEKSLWWFVDPKKEGQ